MTAPAYSVVIPTVGRPSLRTLVETLLAGSGPAPALVTRPEEVRSAPAVAADLPSAVELALAILGRPDQGDRRPDPTRGPVPA